MSNERNAECHPERAYLFDGLCSECYVQRRAKHIVRAETPRDLHAERAAYERSQPVGIFKEKPE